MDKEITCINDILAESKEALTTSQISKLIYNKYHLKISRTIVKNYLWSYFRTIIKYDNSNYSYRLEENLFSLEGINMVQQNETPRPVSATYKGSEIEVKYDEKIPKEIYVKAIAILSINNKPIKSNSDLLKQFNRVIEQISNENG